MIITRSHTAKRSTSKGWDGKNKNDSASRPSSKQACERVEYHDPTDARSLRGFVEGRARRSAHSKLYSDMDALITVAYKNGIAALDWKEAGIVLIAERDEDGNVAIKKSKHR